MANDDQSIVARALPPATDYITYLMILEYNLKKTDLPLLHRLLQDSTLTINIGWDLIHILLPLLPASKQCLVDVARLGNPREVILKVAELLGKTGRSLWNDKEEDTEKEEDSDSDSDETVSPDKQVEPHDASGDGVKKEQHESSYRSVIEFQALLNMISIVYPRIKTKHPSKFLISAFEAILPAYTRVTSSALSTLAMLTLIEKLCESAKPPLPPREHSSVNRQFNSEQSVAPDPEGREETMASAEPGVQIRLLRSFITHVIEIYFECLPNIDDGPGLAWTQRYLEIQYPERVVPFHKTMQSRSTPAEHANLRPSHTLNDLNKRDLIAQKLIVCTIFCYDDIEANSAQQKSALYQVKVPWTDVSWVARHSADDFLVTGGKEANPAVQSTYKDFPLSRKGMLYLLGAELASKVLREKINRPPQVLGFHFESAMAFLDPDLAAIGTEPLAVLDTILLLSVTRLQDNSEFVAEFTDDKFYLYIQKMSLVAANAPSSSIRHNAHLIVTKILHAYPSKEACLNYIQDTFENCPYENLLVCTVGWLKDEILAATAGKNAAGNQTLRLEQGRGKPYVPLKSDQELTFAKPETFKSLSEYLFSIDSPGEHPGGYMGQIPFYMTALNLYYLLWVSPVVRDRLQIPAFEKKCDIQGQFIKPLKAVCQTLLDDPPMAGLRSEHEVSEVQLLETTVDMVLAAIAKVQSEGNST